MEAESTQVYPDPEKQEKVVDETVSKEEDKNKSVRMSKTLGLPLQVASTVAYATGFMPVAGWLSGLLMLLLERDSTVRFHSLQSLAIFGGAAVLQVLLGQTVLFDRLASLVYLIQFVAWLLLMYQTPESWEERDGLL